MRAMAHRLDVPFQLLAASAAGLSLLLMMLMVRWKIYGMPSNLFRPQYGVAAAILTLLLALLYWVPRQRLWQLPVSALAYLFLGITLLSEVARWLWFAELLTHFRVQVFAGLALVSLASLLVRNWISAGCSILACLWHVPMLLPYMAPAEQPHLGESKSIRVLVANVFFANDNYAAFRKLVADEKPDLIAATEITYDWQRETESLSLEYIYRRVLSSSHEFVDGIAVWSKIPIKDVQIQKSRSDQPWWIVVTFDIRQSPLTLILAHPPNPIHPTSAVIRDQQIKEIALHVSQIKGEVIVCGDFNASPWSPIMSRFTRQSGLRDSRLGFGAQPTWPAHLPGLRTPIDYCFVSRGIGVQNFRRGMSFGSDHLPIIADLAIPLSR